MNETNERVSYIFEVNSQEAVKDVQNLIKSFTDMNKSFKDINTQSNNLSSGLKKTTNGFRLLKTAVKSFVGVELGKFMADAAKNTIDYYETLNLFQVAMKGAVDEGNAFIASIQEMYGLDPKNLMEYTGLFYEMAYAVEAPQEAAQTLSTSLTALTVDLASLYNVDIDRVANNLMSGMRGMSRAVLRYGLDLRATTVEAYANSMGITEQYETMNEASREILRYLVAVKQAEDAMGDFAETAEQPANQLRILKEQVSQLGRAIGWFLIAPLEDLMPKINGMVMALRTMIEMFAAFTGVLKDAEQSAGSAGENGEKSLEGIEEAAKGATKQVKSLLAPFDELNILKQSQSGSGDSLDYGEVDPRLLALLQESQYQMQELELKANGVRDSILSLFGIKKNKEGIWEFLLTDADQTVQDLYGIFGSIKDIGIEVAQNVGSAVDGILSTLGLDNISFDAVIDKTRQKLSEFNTWMSENKQTIIDYATALLLLVATISGVGLAIAGISSAFAVFGSIKALFLGIIPAVTKFGTTMSALGAPFASVVKWATGISKALTALVGSTSLVVAGVMVMVAAIVTAFTDMMANNEQFRENFDTTISNIIGFIKALISVIDALVSAAINTIGIISDVVKPILPFINGIINAIIGVLTGLVKFIEGVLTYDLSLVLDGIKMMFSGLFEAIGHIFVGIVNGIMTAIATIINGVGALIYHAVSEAFDLANAIAGIFGHEGWTAPDKSNFQVNVNDWITVPKLNDYTAMATGGVVTAPTRALIGEAGRSEAVIPLDNSPQMQNFISQIVDAIGATNNRPVEARVYLDGKSLSRALYNDMQSEGVRRGKSLVTTSR